MPYSGLDISEKVCLVTGGTSGIGRAMAMGFAAAGARVAAGSSSAEKVAGIQKELGPEHLALRIDVADEQSVKTAIGQTVARCFGRLDAVVNAAGIIKRQPSLEMPPAEFERILRVNLTGSFIVAQAAGRVMKERTPDASCAAAKRSSSSPRSTPTFRLPKSWRTRAANPASWAWSGVWPTNGPSTAFA